MVERRVCTFCGDEIEPGTGRMYIKKDGVVYQFCTSKCFKNMVLLGRVPRRTTWTRYYEREKQVRMKGLPVAAEGPKARKLRKTEEKPEEKPEAEGIPEEPEPKPEPEKKPVAKPARKPAPKKEKPKEEAPKRAPKPAEGEKE